MFSIKTDGSCIELSDFEDYDKAVAYSMEYCRNNKKNIDILEDGRPLRRFEWAMQGDQRFVRDLCPIKVGIHYPTCEDRVVLVVGEFGDKQFTVTDVNRKGFWYKVDIYGRPIDTKTISRKDLIAWPHEVKRWRMFNRTVPSWFKCGVATL
tara:strand:- start:11902 stop:12354 length:453 start_codon:yes stop_codon:yes gene_type:complete